MNRTLKRLVLRGLSPLDAAARWINGKGQLPPLHLRWDVGPLRAFESDAAEYRVFLKLFAGMTSRARVLDLGCGCGQMAIELADWLDDEGRYVGCDISRDAIRWCERSIAASDRRLAFHHMDIRNGMYNPRGQTAAKDYTFPPSLGKFDVILIKSVFTHMLRDDVEHYISRIPALLAQDGACLCTFFLLNKEQGALELQGRNIIRFQRGSNGIAFANPFAPEQIVAFPEDEVRAMAKRHGLVIATPVRYGAWAGRRDALSHQDILVLHKKKRSR